MFFSDLNHKYLCGLNDGSRKDSPFSNALFVCNFIKFLVDFRHVGNFLKNDVYLVKFEKVLKGIDLLRFCQVVLEVL